jgi:hypothetical protein
MADHHFDIPHRVRSRIQLFKHAAANLADRRVLYLEFGVYEGGSMRVWSQLLRHPGASLHGFDTFTGLPERWNDLTVAGAFSMQGQPPSIGDPRVRFFKGLFEETLASYMPPPAETLFVNVDCDLYSSTNTVLRWLESHLRVGSYLYFDEFSNRAHELRAFSEFLDRTRFKFTLVGATKTLAQVLFRCKEVPAPKLAEGSVSTRWQSQRGS